MCPLRVKNTKPVLLRTKILIKFVFQNITNSSMTLSCHTKFSRTAWKVCLCAFRVAMGVKCHTHKHVSMYVYICTHIHTHTYIYMKTHSCLPHDFPAGFSQVSHRMFLRDTTWIKEKSYSLVMQNTLSLLHVLSQPQLQLVVSTWILQQTWTAASACHAHRCHLDCLGRNKCSLGDYSLPICHDRRRQKNPPEELRQGTGRRLRARISQIWADCLAHYRV